MQRLGGEREHGLADGFGQGRVGWCMDATSSAVASQFVISMPRRSGR
jgi:hypothetical protein